MIWTILAWALWLLPFVPVYIASGMLAMWIYTVRILRNNPHQTSLERADRQGLVAVFLFSPILLLWYLISSVFGLMFSFASVAARREVKLRAVREKERLRQEEIDRMESMSSEERLLELERLMSSPEMLPLSLQGKESAIDKLFIEAKKQVAAKEHVKKRRKKKELTEYERIAFMGNSEEDSPF